MKLHTHTKFVSWLAAAAWLAAGARAQQLVRSVNGPAADAQFGRACIRISDQNSDGYKDLLVGAPGFNQERGAIYCISGAYLATGSGVSTLWSVAPAANIGDHFGWSLAELGDVTGDGVSDFLVGEPGYGSPSDWGAVRLVNGAAHTVVSMIWGFEPDCTFGTAIAACGDSNGNGMPEVAIGAPGPNSTTSRVFVLDAVYLSNSGKIDTLPASFVAAPGSDQMGASIASGFDIDGDGRQEYVVGSPGADNGSLLDSGRVLLFSNGGSGGNLLGYLYSSVAGEHLGSAVDGGGDYDGDGVRDIIAGAPDWADASGSHLGRALVLSGARLVAHTPPYEIHTLTTASGSLIGGSHFHFGAAVRACADLNNDGVGDILVGAPDYTSYSPFPTNYGFAAIISGATGTRLGTIFGSAKDHFGDAITGSVGDFDGDGFKEFVVAGALSDAGGSDSGVIKCYRLFPLAPAAYCTGKVNSLGCTPAMGFTGSPSASPGTSFTISANNFVNQKSGLLFYSHEPITIAFQGGFKCVASPTRRTLSQNSGGATTGSSCTGTYSFNFKSWMSGGSDPSLVAGAEVYAQYWSRDPASPSTTSLSNALRFVVNP